MSLSPLRTETAAKDNTPFQSAVQDLIANEMIFAVVGPVGSGTSEIAESLGTLLTAKGYDATILKAREVIVQVAERNGIPIPASPPLAQSVALQDAGDRIRAGSNDNAAVAVGLIGEIRAKRAHKRQIEAAEGQPVEPDGQKRAFILDSLRHPQEVALLRRVYHEAFCLIGVFCHEEERLRRLQNEKYSGSNKVEIESFMERDENAPEAYGQKVSDTFHLSDFFVDNSVDRFVKIGGKSESNPDWDVSEQLGRLIDILTHSRIVRPRPAETGMFHAYGARMRSSCLSRQVGAALLDKTGSLLATGTNEVPRAGGGVYGGVPLDGVDGDPDADRDFRCFVHHGYCSNTRQQNELIKSLFSGISELSFIKMDDDLLKRIRKTQIGQILEFSRAVHAEMDALLSAARSGTRTVGTRLFVTTFPCHNCARHIVAAGVSEVQYIEPYLKSQAIPLHGDAVVTSPKQWNPLDEASQPSNPKTNPNVLFRAFIGVAPRLYRRAFFKDRDLKDGLTGNLIQNFGPADGYATTDTLRVSYAQVEARLAALQIEARK